MKVWKIKKSTTIKQLVGRIIHMQLEISHEVQLSVSDAEKPDILRKTAE